MQALLNGLVSGLALALLATGFQTVYLPTGVFFLSLAAIYAAAPFIALSVLKGGGWWLVAIPSAVLVSVVLCVLCEWANHAPLARRQASQSAHLIASLGIYIVLVQVLVMVWGNDTMTLPVETNPASHCAGLVITHAQWSILGIAVALLAGFAAMLMYSRFGLRLRALADDPVQFALFGYDATRHRLLAFGLAGVLTAASSLVTAYDTGFAPYGGLHMLLLAIVSVIIGGRRSFVGPIVGAILLCILRDQVAWHLSARWQEPFTFALLAVFLLVRPQGLFGHTTRLEATTQ